jgi:hypothetical protein
VTKRAKLSPNGTFARRSDRISENVSPNLSSESDSDSDQLSPVLRAPVAIVPQGNEMFEGSLISGMTVAVLRTHLRALGITSAPKSKTDMVRALIGAMGDPIVMQKTLLPSTPSFLLDPVISAIRPDTVLKIAFEDGACVDRGGKNKDKDEAAECASTILQFQPVHSKKPKNAQQDSVEFTESQIEMIELLPSLKATGYSNQPQPAPSRSTKHQQKQTQQTVSNSAKIIALSGFDPDDRAMLARIVERLQSVVSGGSVVLLSKDADELAPATHVVVTENDTKRTMRVLSSLACGNSYILTQNWLFASLDGWVDENEFLHPRFDSRRRIRSFFVGLTGSFLLQVLSAA